MLYTIISRFSEKESTLREQHIGEKFVICMSKYLAIETKIQLRWCNRCEWYPVTISLTAIVGDYDKVVKRLHT